MTPKLTTELRTVVDEHDGGPVFVDAGGATYILMSVEAYRSLMGVESDEDLADSVAHLRAAMEQARSGRSRPLRDAVDAIAERHGLSR